MDAIGSFFFVAFGILIFYTMLCLGVSTLGETRSIGRGPLFIISFLLSPLVGFLIALLYPSNDNINNSDSDKNIMTNNSFKNCPMCAEKVLEAAKICKHCRHMFEESE